MQSKAAKIGIVVVMFLVFGGFIYLNYGPNSHQAQQDAATTERLKNYVRTEAEIITSESNGRVGKGADQVYTLQFKEEKTGEFRTSKFYGTHAGWGSVDRNIGGKVIIYYDPENPYEIESEEVYNAAKR